MNSRLHAGTDEILAAVAAYGLAGTRLDLPTRPLQDDEWHALVDRVRAERLTGLLAAAVTGGPFAVTDRQRAEVVDAHVESMASVLVLERLLLEAADALQAAGLPFRVLKGSAVAHLDYTDPALRPFGDVDLLVVSEHVRSAVQVLQAAGITLPVAQVRPGFAERFGKSVTLQTVEGLELDLHRTLAPGAYGLRLPVERLWHSSVSFTVGGTRLQALGHEERLLHAAYHCVLGGRVRSLLSLRDVAEMALYGTFLHDRLRETAKRWGGEAVLAEAVRRAWGTFHIADVTALSRWAERYQVSVQERRLIDVYEAPDTTYAAQALTALGALPGVRSKAAFVTSLALPDRDFLQTRDMSRRQWLLRGVGRTSAAARQMARRRR